MEVDLVDPATHGVYAEVEALAPAATRPMRLVLANGSYAFTCFPDGSDAETGPTVTIKDGPARGAVAVPATSENDLAASVQVYRAHVIAGLAKAGSLGGMLSFVQRPNTRPVILDETTGAVVRN